MNKLKEELEEWVNREPFTPFVVTANDGFAIAVSNPKRVLLGLRILAVTDERTGQLFHFPFSGIAHISEATPEAPEAS